MHTELSRKGEPRSHSTDGPPLAAVSVGPPLATVSVGPPLAAVSDGQLLARFADAHDEQAFATLVERYGRLVFGLCCRVLHHRQDAEDAFQATFLVLAAKANAISKRESVGSWLYGVAHRVARRAKMNSNRRRSLKPTAPVVASENPEQDAWRDLQPILDEELSQMPEKYRTPFVQHYLEGKRYDEIAAHLGCPKTTVTNRLARARDWLRKAFERRGVALSTAVLTGAVAEQASAAAVPSSLIFSTVKAAAAVSAQGLSASGLVSAQVATLASATLQELALLKIKSLVAALLVAGLLGGGAVLTHAPRALAHAGPPANPASPARARPVARVRASVSGARVPAMMALAPTIASIEAPLTADDPLPSPALAPLAIPAALLTPVALPQPESEPVNSGPLSEVIDGWVERRLAEKRIKPSPLADDAEFLRRVTLDLLGRIPRPERVDAFLSDADPQKRSKLVDELLSSPEYGRNFGIVWQNRIGPRSDFVGNEAEHALFPWLAEQFNRNRPWNELVSDMLSAEGEVNDNLATGFYLAAANTVEGVVQADRVTGLAAQLFLGVNLRCAQCHDHPFAPWKQTEFWGLAAFFGRVGFTDKATYNKVLRESANIRDRGDQKIATARDDASIVIPIKQTVVRARLLDGTEPKLDAQQPFRLELARWTTSARNPWFVRAAVNRTWAHFFGRGLVMPIEDMNDDGTHPELLEALGERFVDSGFDLKQLARSICNSRAYQRTSRPTDDNAPDQTLYSHMTLRQLSPEVLYDSLASLIIGRQYDTDLPKTVLDPGRYRFVTLFRDQQDDATKYTHSIPQVLNLLNGKPTGFTPLLATQLRNEQIMPEQAVERIFIAVLARRPMPEETQMCVQLRQPNQGFDQFCQAVEWLLCNTAEFTINH